MASIKWYAQAGLFAACAVVSIASLVNDFSNNPDVFEQPKRAACPTSSAAACGLTHMDRSPFGQSFEYTTRSGVIAVHCARAAVFFGDYACEKR
jgi:hypothetical protein